MRTRSKRGDGVKKKKAEPPSSFGTEQPTKAGFLFLVFFFLEDFICLLQSFFLFHLQSQSAQSNQSNKSDPLGMLFPFLV